MIDSLILITGKEEQQLAEETLMISLSNAKQLIIGRVPNQGGIIIHVAANSHDDLKNTLLDFSQLPEVAQSVLLMVRTVQ
jgi:nitrate reductase NapAB chaperone NapD